MKTTIQVLPAAQSSGVSFALLSGVVFKISTFAQRSELILEDDNESAAQVAKIMLAAAKASQPNVTVSVTEASEQDLLEAQAESPEVAARLEGLLRHLRTAQPDTQPQPLKVEIVNPEELKPDKPETNRRIHVERDSSGTLTGAVVTDA
jgi:hypothetical protein